MSSSPLPESESEEQIAKKKKNRRNNRIFLFIIFSLVVWHYIAGRQAENEWNEFKNHWEAKGEIFDLEELIPPEIPDEDNFTAAPIIAELFDGTQTPRLSKLDLHQIPGLQPPTLSSATQKKEPYNSHWMLGASVAPLSRFLDKPDPSSTNEDDARAILEALLPLAPEITELLEATQRPDARYPVGYFGAALHNSYELALEKSIKLLILHSRALFESGESEAGRIDLLAALRMANLIGVNPTYQSVMMESSYYRNILAVIWDGLKSGQIRTTDLKLINTVLQNQNPKQHLALAIRTDRAVILASLEEAVSTTESSLIDIPASDELVKILKLLHMSKVVWFKNILTYCQFLQLHGLSTNDKVNLTEINLETAMGADEDRRKLRKDAFPMSIIAIMGEIPLSSMAQQAIQNSTRIDLARVAIALEIYRREHDAYPDTLASLAPQYIDTIPPDFVTGDPLHYRIKTDGTPMIYSVGLNETDENGLLKFDRAKGDWTWQYTLPKNFSEKNRKE